MEYRVEEVGEEINAVICFVAQRIREGPSSMADIITIITSMSLFFFFLSFSVLSLTRPYFPPLSPFACFEYAADFHTWPVPYWPFGLFLWYMREISPMKPYLNFR